MYPHAAPSLSLPFRNAAEVLLKHVQLILALCCHPVHRNAHSGELSISSRPRGKTHYSSTVISVEETQQSRLEVLNTTWFCRLFGEGKRGSNRGKQNTKMRVNNPHSSRINVADMCRGETNSCVPCPDFAVLFSIQRQAENINKRLPLENIASTPRRVNCNALWEMFLTNQKSRLSSVLGFNVD